jgi:hypothetical protein
MANLRLYKINRFVHHLYSFFFKQKQQFFDRSILTSLIDNYSNLSALSQTLHCHVG